MIISEGRSYVFVHIPKTGGTSLAHALEDRAMKDDILIGDTPKAHRRRGRVQKLQASGRLWKHATLADIDGLVSVQALQSCFVFTLVRNPWDRMASYYHWLRHQSFDHAAVTLAKEHTFEGFVLHDAIQQSFRASPARSYVTRADGIEQCNVFIRLEHFQSDAAPLFAHLGFDLHIPHLNRSDRRSDYRMYYTTEMVDAVAASCAEDIQRFGYSF